MGAWSARAGVFFCFLMVFCTVSVSSLWGVESASIVICAETGKVHHEQNADTITHPASLTKMMTLYLTFKALREKRLALNQKLPVSKHATLAAPSKLGLTAKSTITVIQAIRALATKSANDAAVVLAEKLGKGSEPHFATLMTHQARYLGMSRTIFKNAHGLPNKEQVTTARDMAILSRCLYKHFPEYYKFFKEPDFAYKGQVHKNHNTLLGEIPGVPGIVDGIKTGFINASGFNLAASMVRGNSRIIAVVMGGETRQARDKKMVKLLKATYSKLTGKKRHTSIDDLLHALTPSEDSITPIKSTMHQAVYRGQCKPVKVEKAQYTSVDHLLNELDEEPKPALTPKKKVQKSFPKKITYLSKKRLNKGAVNRIRTLDNKPTLRLRKRKK